MSVWFCRFGARPGTRGRMHLLARLELEEPIDSMHNLMIAACGVRARRTSIAYSVEQDAAPADACQRCGLPRDPSAKERK